METIYNNQDLDDYQESNGSDESRGSSLRSLAAPKNTRGGGSSSSMKNSRRGRRHTTGNNNNTTMF